jgi:hypothetical protein
VHQGLHRTRAGSDTVNPSGRAMASCVRSPFRSRIVGVEAEAANNDVVGHFVEGPVVGEGVRAEPDQGLVDADCELYRIQSS